MTAPTAVELWDWLNACQTCGKPHQYRPPGWSCGCCGQPRNWGTWADPDDGHSYRRRDTSDLDRLRAQWAWEVAR